VEIIDPPIVVNYNKCKNIDSKHSKGAFNIIIKPQDLFKSFQTHVHNAERVFLRYRYRHIMVLNYVKQYLRENLFLGEIEIEV